MAVQLEHRLLTVREYHRMAETGMLHADDHVELLNGQIIKRVQSVADMPLL